MKKLVLIFLSILLLSSCLTACANTTSQTTTPKKDTATKISLSSLENEFRKSDDDFTFSVSPSSSGYSFSYKNRTFNINYSGTADGNKNVTSLTITHNEIDGSLLTNRSKMYTVLNKLSTNLTSMTLGESKAASCFVNLGIVYSFLNLSTNTSDILTDLSTNKTTTQNGWTVTSNVSGSTHTITMSK